MKWLKLFENFDENSLDVDLLMDLLVSYLDEFNITEYNDLVDRYPGLVPGNTINGYYFRADREFRYSEDPSNGELYIKITLYYKELADKFLEELNRYKIRLEKMNLNCKIEEVEENYMIYNISITR